MRILKETLDSHTGEVLPLHPASFDRWWHRRVVEPALPTPRPAGVWDALLGGDTHSSADRTVADELRSSASLTCVWADTLIDFRDRIVTALADAGCRQWLDLGAGLPTATSLYYHLCTRTKDRHRLVVVDNDRFVIDCNRLYTSTGPRRITVATLPADLTVPTVVGHRLHRLRFLDLTRPVTVVAGAVLHHLTEQQAIDVLTALRRTLVPGSRLIVTHLASVDPDPNVKTHHAHEAMQHYLRTTGPLYPRTGGQITDLIGAGWTVSPSGLTAISGGSLPEQVAAWGLTGKAAESP